MSIAIGVTKDIENDGIWKVYKNYVADTVSLSHHIIDLELANCKGEPRVEFLHNIGKYVDYGFSYRYIVENHKVDHLVGKVKGRCTINVAQCMQRVANAFCTCFTELNDGYDAYVNVSQAPKLIFTKIAGHKTGNTCFSVPFIKGLLLTTPGIQPHSNISFITVTDSRQESYIYILLGNQLYSFSGATMLRG